MNIFELMEHIEGNLKTNSFTNGYGKYVTKKNTEIDVIELLKDVINDTSVEIDDLFTQEEIDEAATKGDDE